MVQNTIGWKVPFNKGHKDATFSNSFFRYPFSVDIELFFIIFDNVHVGPSTEDIYLKKFLCIRL